MRCTLIWECFAEFNDIVILPVAENMNSGKSYAFFTWAAKMALVPPIYFDTEIPPPMLSYSNVTSPMLSLAQHDPVYAWRDRQSASSLAQDWVRPDFIVKVDDDSFVMLAELEAHLRVALHDQGNVDVHHQENSSTSDSSAELPSAQPARDPLIYWGYLVKRRFMAGEMYALSWSLVDWISNEPALKGLVNGAEDKQTAKWMRLHPRAAQVRWVAERCWIYDHPRSGTVYVSFFSASFRLNQAWLDIPMAFYSLLRPNVSGTVSEPSSTGSRYRQLIRLRQPRVVPTEIGTHQRSGLCRLYRHLELGIRCHFPT